jgi:hypothetical protein
VHAGVRPGEHDDHAKPCARCGGRAVYWQDAIVPGNPLAPRGSRTASAQPRPAWHCLACGHLEPEERRARQLTQRTG